MLILSRQQGQVICIGDDITICVTQIDGNNVKLGIGAPKNVRIDRREVRMERLTHRETDLTVLRDIYFEGVLDAYFEVAPRYNPKWGSTANKAYALAFEEYQNG
jgi:carbon storage regulator